MVALVSSAGAISAGLVFDGPSFYERPGIRDYDQRRDALASDGSMHCVPTAYVDQFKYLAAAGLSNMDGSYSGSYADITDFINLLGFLMGTNTNTGTGSEFAFDVGTAWINDHTGQLVYNNYYGPDWDWGSNTIKNSVASGAINVIGYGRYYKHNDSWIRDGGHAVALAGYDWRNSTKKLIVSDPASTSNDTNGINGQGDFTHDYKNTSNITLTTEDWGQVTHARYTFFTGEATDYLSWRRVIDSMHQIRPVWAGWYETNVDTSVEERSAGDGSVKTVVPFQLEGQAFEPHEVVPREEMVDWVYDLGAAAVFYVTKLGRIFYVDLVTGEDKLVHVVKGAKALMVGGSTNDLYVLVNGQPRDTIYCFERDDMHLDTDRAPDGPRKNFRTLPGHGIALEYDPISGGPAVLSSGLNVGWTLDENLSPGPDMTVPPLEPGSGQVIFKIDHLTGDLLLTREGEHSFWRASRRGGEAIRQSPRLAHGITALVPTESNCLLVQDGDTLQTYDRSGALRPTQLSNLVVGGKVKMSRSHFAAKRGTMVGPKWRNLTEAELAD